MDIEMPLNQYIKQVGSEKRTPGGGSVAAICGSLGCALTSMVGNLTFKKEAFQQLNEEQKQVFQHSFEELHRLIKQFNHLAKEDTYAFEGVLKAMKLPKNTEEEKEKRNQDMEKATKDALKTPLNTAKLALQALELQEVFIKWGNIDTMSDVGVGIWAAYGGLEGAVITVKINLFQLSDEEYKQKIIEECEDIVDQGRKLRDRHLEEVYSKLDQ